MRKITILGGGGVRTPLLIHGLAQAQQALGAGEIALFDADPSRAETIARIGREIAARLGASFDIRVYAGLDEAAAGADFVLSSIRVGGIATRARDERLAIDHGFAGQETTGPAGAAMALRTVPVALEHARVVERVAPNAWFISFTNPAGLIAQAVSQNTALKVVGICDTPTELFHRIAEALRAPLRDMTFDYVGLNHLGWVRRVLVGGEDVTEALLADAELLRGLYPAELFDPALIQTLRLIPTEYLFFYYQQRRALRNQLKAGASRGEELVRMNSDLFDQLAAAPAPRALEIYRDYLIRRNASYMKIEGQAGSAFEAPREEPDPFDAATGYHRIALDLMLGLLSDTDRVIVLNVPNRGAIDDLEPDDVVEVPCLVNRTGAHPRAAGPLPEAVRGLVQSVKAYERTAIRSALENSPSLARLALLQNPIVGQWDAACEIVDALNTADTSAASPETPPHRP